MEGTLISISAFKFLLMRLCIMVRWYTIKQGHSPVLGILRHSGSDPQTLRWINVTTCGRLLVSDDGLSRSGLGTWGLPLGLEGRPSARPANDIHRLIALDCRRQYFVWRCIHKFWARPAHNVVIFRSTSKSRPNNIRGGKNVRPYVHRKFLRFQWNLVYR